MPSDLRSVAAYAPMKRGLKVYHQQGKPQLPVHLSATVDCQFFCGRYDESTFSMEGIMNEHKVVCQQLIIEDENGERKIFMSTDNAKNPTFQMSGDSGNVHINFTTDGVTLSLSDKQGQEKATLYVKDGEGWCRFLRSDGSEIQWWTV